MDERKRELYNEKVTVDWEKVFSFEINRLDSIQNALVSNEKNLGFGKEQELQAKFSGTLVHVGQNLEARVFVCMIYPYQRK